MPTGVADLRLRTLKSHFLFHELTSGELEALLGYSRLQSFAANETIYFRGAPGDSMMAILRGEVRISLTGHDGHEITLALLGEGDILGEIAVIDGRERTADAIAASPCDALVIERGRFISFIEGRPLVALKLLGALCDKLRRSTAQVEELALLDLPNRLARRLIGLARSRGQRTPRGIRIAMSFTQTDLANMLGASRERVNKLLMRWRHDGIIDVVRGVIVVTDTARLEAIAGEAGEAQRPTA